MKMSFFMLKLLEIGNMVLLFKFPLKILQNTRPQIYNKCRKVGEVSAEWKHLQREIVARVRGDCECVISVATASSNCQCRCMKNGTAVLIGYKKDGWNKGDSTFQERLVGEGVSFKASLHLGQQHPSPPPSPLHLPSLSRLTKAKWLLWFESRAASKKRRKKSGLQLNKQDSILTADSWRQVHSTLTRHGRAELTDFGKRRQTFCPLHSHSTRAPASA